MKYEITLTRTAEYVFTITPEELNGRTLAEWIEEQREDNWLEVECQRFGGDIFTDDTLEVNDKEINLFDSLTNQLKEG